MITCINLSRPRYKVVETYDNILFNYKMRYTKEQIKIHKRIYKAGLYMLVSISIKYVIAYHIAALSMPDIFHSSDGQTSSDLFKDINKFSNDSYNDMNKSITDMNTDLGKSINTYTDSYWDSLTKSMDKALAPTFHQLDNLPKINMGK